jgi:hypothetical protein
MTAQLPSGPIHGRLQPETDAGSFARPQVAGAADLDMVFCLWIHDPI